MLPADKVIKEILVTEKETMLSANFNQYTFEVYPAANRIEVAHAVESLFNVKVARVNLFNKKGKRKRSRTQRGVYGRTRNQKRAIVTLKEGSTIELV